MLPFLIPGLLGAVAGGLSTGDLKGALLGGLLGAIPGLAGGAGAAAGAGAASAAPALGTAGLDAIAGTAASAAAPGLASVGTGIQAIDAASKAAQTAQALQAAGTASTVAAPGVAQAVAPSLTAQTSAPAIDALSKLAPGMPGGPGLPGVQEALKAGAPVPPEASTGFQGMMDQVRAYQGSKPLTSAMLAGTGGAMLSSLLEKPEEAQADESPPYEGPYLIPRGPTVPYGGTSSQGSPPTSNASTYLPGDSMGGMARYGQTSSTDPSGEHMFLPSAAEDGWLDNILAANPREDKDGSGEDEWMSGYNRLLGLPTRGRKAGGEISGIMDTVKAYSGAPVKGAGDGLSDSIPAMAGKQPYDLSKDEHIVPADVIAALGGGSSDAGHAKLQELIGSIRERATGTRQQVKPVAVRV